jgi:hypothetical protein
MVSPSMAMLAEGEGRKRNREARRRAASPVSFVEVEGHQMERVVGDARDHRREPAQQTIRSRGQWRRTPVSGCRASRR